MLWCRHWWQNHKMPVVSHAVQGNHSWSISGHSPAWWRHEYTNVVFLTYDHWSTVCFMQFENWSKFGVWGALWTSKLQQVSAVNSFCVHLQCSTRDITTDEFLYTSCLVCGVTAFLCCVQVNKVPGSSSEKNVTVYTLSSGHSWIAVVHLPGTRTWTHDNALSLLAHSASLESGCASLVVLVSWNNCQLLSQGPATLGFLNSALSSLIWRSWWLHYQDHIKICW